KERTFTFSDMKKESARCANYFKALGIKRGDRVMLVLKRHYQYWFAVLGLHKLGAVAIPAPNQLLEKDFAYRFEAGKVKAILCTADGGVSDAVDEAAAQCPELAHKILVNGKKDGWHDFNEEYAMYSSHFARAEDAPCGDDPMLMFFTSGTSGYPKLAAHNYKYPLGHFITAKYWHRVNPDGLHLTISDTGWAKASWGKLYGQWLCEAGLFVYDFDRFDGEKILYKDDAFQHFSSRDIYCFAEIQRGYQWSDEYSRGG
ncbi:MAG: AMP-binding protein, partial [Lentisphaeria bacterium]|nr:AMP-binding protein [Lentisphaeria bacterium]